MLSAVMELFIRIPYVKRKADGNIFATGFGDLQATFRYMYREQPLILKFSVLIAGINLILSALMIIGLPVIVTQLLGFLPETANTLYGYAQGVSALGSLCGGLGAGILAKRLIVRNGYKILCYDALTLVPIGIVLVVPVPRMLAYGIIMVSCFVMMFLATLFSVQIMSYLQMIVPECMLGKVISCAMCIGMCASPLGQAIYGGLFQTMQNQIGLLFFSATIITVLIAFGMKKEYVKLDKLLKEQKEEK